jgi:hypothetical protein
MDLPPELLHYSGKPDDRKEKLAFRKMVAEAALTLKRNRWGPAAAALWRRPRFLLRAASGRALCRTGRVWRLTPPSGWEMLGCAGPDECCACGGWWPLVNAATMVEACSAEHRRGGLLQPRVAGDLLVLALLASTSPPQYAAEQRQPRSGNLTGGMPACVQGGVGGAAEGAAVGEEVGREDV